MTIHPRRLRAAFLLSALAICGSGPIGCAALAASSNNAVDVPAYRQLGAGEAMTAPGQNGSDGSANAPALTGLTLLATIPAATAPRRGYFVQAQCTAGLTVVLDDEAGSLAPTIVVLAGSGTEGGQGGSLDMAGMPHTGRIRIFSSNAACQMAARSW